MFSFGFALFLWAIDEQSTPLVATLLLAEQLMGNHFVEVQTAGSVGERKESVHPGKVPETEKVHSFVVIETDL